MTNVMAKALLHLPKEINTSENGKMAKLMAKVPGHGLMEKLKREG